MVFSFIKNWVKEWILWGWVLFISLLASQNELSSPLTPIEVRDSAKPDQDAFAEFCRKTQDKLKADDRNKKIEKATKNTTTVRTLGRLRPAQKSEISKETLIEPQVKSQPKHEEPQEEAEEVWCGGAQKLTRYAGLENLVMNDESLNDKSRGFLAQGNISTTDDSVQSHVKSIPAENLDETDKLWEELVSRYTDEDSIQKNIQEESNSQQQARPHVLEDFNSLVDDRLQEYLSRIDENVEIDELYQDFSSNEVRDIEEEIGQSLELQDPTGAENQIFIMIEDDEPQEARSDDEKTGDKPTVDKTHGVDLPQPAIATVSEGHGPSSAEFEEAKHSASAKDLKDTSLVTGKIDGTSAPKHELQEFAIDKDEPIEILDKDMKIEDEKGVEAHTAMETNHTKLDDTKTDVIDKVECLMKDESLDCLTIDSKYLEDKEIEDDLKREGAKERNISMEDIEFVEGSTEEDVSDRENLKDLTHDRDTQEKHIKDTFTKNLEVAVREEKKRFTDDINNCTRKNEEIEPTEGSDILSKEEIIVAVDEKILKLDSSVLAKDIQEHEDLLSEELDDKGVIVTREPTDPQLEANTEGTDPFTTTFEEFIDDVSEESAEDEKLLDFKDAGGLECEEYIHEELQEHESIPAEVAREIIVVKGIYTPASSVDESESNDDDNDVVGEECNNKHLENDNMLRLKAIGLTDSESEFVSMLVANQESSASSARPTTPEDPSNLSQEFEENELIINSDIIGHKEGESSRLGHLNLPFTSSLIHDKRLNSALSTKGELKTEMTKKCDTRPDVIKAMLPDIPENDDEDDYDFEDSEGSDGIPVDWPTEIDKHDGNDKGLHDEGAKLPKYLDDVKDLLVPRARRKKPKKRLVELDHILKVEAKPSTSFGEMKTDLEKEVSIPSFREIYPYEEKESTVPSDDQKTDSYYELNEQEKKELQEIGKEQEAVRAAHRKELDRFLAMPYALTEQEQKELEEFVAEEETNKKLTDASEARLAVFLADVRARLGQEEPYDEGNLDQYMELPPVLTEDEELLLSSDSVEKERNDFSTEKEYKEYVKNKYLQGLEDERQRVLEDEFYYEDYDYDDEYSYEVESAGSSDILDQEYPLKNQAAGPDVPMGEDTHQNKKMKKNWSLPSLRSKESPKGSKNSLNSSSMGSLDDDNKEGKDSQTKFFRYGSLGPKRKKKM